MNRDNGIRNRLLTGYIIGFFGLLMLFCVFAVNWGLQFGMARLYLLAGLGVFILGLWHVLCGPIHAVFAFVLYLFICICLPPSYFLLSVFFLFGMAYPLWKKGLKEPPLSAPDIPEGLFMHNLLGETYLLKGTADTLIFKFADNGDEEETFELQKEKIQKIEINRDLDSEIKLYLYTIDGHMMEYGIGPINNEDNLILLKNILKGAGQDKLFIDDAMQTKSNLSASRGILLLAFTGIIGLRWILGGMQWWTIFPVLLFVLPVGIIENVRQNQYFCRTPLSVYTVAAMVLSLIMMAAYPCAVIFSGSLLPVFTGILISAYFLSICFFLLVHGCVNTLFQQIALFTGCYFYSLSAMSYLFLFFLPANF